MATVNTHTGIVAAGDPQSAQAGAAMFAHGGNAIDAAVAAAFAACVAESVIVNISGGGVATWHDSRTNTVQCLDFFSTMPSGKIQPDSDFREVVLDFGATTQSFFIGRASVAVPGVVSGLTTLLAQAGSLPLATVLQPAIQLARHGAVISQGMDYMLSLLVEIFTDTPALGAIYAPNGTLKRAGDTFTMPQFAETLEQLAISGPALFSTGEVAQAIVADQAENGGLVTLEDLAAYRPILTTPIQVAYRDTQVFLPPPSSTGGVLIAFALKLLNTVPLAPLAFSSAKRVRVLTEVMRLTSQARATWEQLTSTQAETAVAAFLSDAHLATYITALTANLKQRPAAAQAQDSAPRHTSHISAADRHNNFISVTLSAGENAGYLVGDTGVSLNNMLGEIDLHPLGFHKMPAKQRLATMMSPAFVTKDNHPWLAIGSGGSTRIRSSILQVLNNIVDHGSSLSAAVTAERVHFENNLLQMEPGFPAASIAELQANGYAINQWPEKSMYFGGAQVVQYTKTDGFAAAGDFRRGGAIAKA